MSAGQQVQIRNAQQVALLSQDFQHRREAAFAWARACAMHQGLAGVRGFWPMSANSPDVGGIVAGAATDLSGNNNFLLNANNSTYGYDSLAPYVSFDGNNQYLSKADGGAAAWADITGTEAYIVGPQRGLTIGGWFYFENLARLEGLMSKWDDDQVNQRSYLLRKTAADTLQFLISVDGTAITTVTSTVAPTTASWVHVIGRFNPSTEMTIWVNGVKTDLAAAIPASIFDSTAAFQVGRYDGTPDYLDGRASMCFLCAADLEDTLPLLSYDIARAMYGR